MSDKKLSDDLALVSVSHATLNPEHLIPTFLRFIHENLGHRIVEETIDGFECFAPFLASPENAWGLEPFSIVEEDGWQECFDEHSSEFLECLFDTINEHAPEFTHFGAHEGNGSDFGFWYVETDLRDLGRAIERDHYCDDYASENCDVCQAIGAGYVRVAANLLQSATECPTVYAVFQNLDETECIPYEQEWEQWAEYHEDGTARCSACGSFSWDKDMCSSCGSDMSQEEGV